MRRYLCLLFLCLSATAFSYAQTAGIQGKLSDANTKTPVISATVSLLKQSDSSTVSNTVSRADGSFSFTNLPADSFIVKISSINYQDYLSFVTVTDGIRTLSPISLDPKGQDLASVTVIARTPPVVMKADTAQFSASQYKVNPDATTEDLIKKMPTVTVAKDGTVTAQGETVKKVTIDGKDFFGDDASAALRNLPAEVVDKIQVFDKLSDQAQLTGFDDGNSVKAINVVTKSGIKNGRFGRIYAGYGTDDRYSAGGNASFFKNNRRISIVGNFNNINQQNFGSQDLLGLTSSGGRGGGGGAGGGARGGGGGADFNVGQSAGISKTNALGLNFSNQYGKKVSLTASYFYNNSHNINNTISNTEYFIGSKNFTQPNHLFTDQTSSSATDNTNHRVTARLEYKIDSANSLIITPNLSFQKNNSSSFSNTKNFYGRPTTRDFYDSSTNSLSHVVADRKGYNLRNNVLFRHAFAKRGRSISFGFNTYFTQNDGNTTINGDYRFFDTTGMFTRDSLQNQFYDNSANGHTIGGTVAYTEPVGKKAQVQLDYNPSVQINHADQETFNFDGQKYTAFDSALSNKFDNRITTNNGGVTYRYSPNKDEMFSVGTSFQNSRLQSDRIFPTSSKVDQSFSSVLPNLMWRKKLSTVSSIRLFYRASVNFPSVTQLQDVVNSTNPLRVSVGNPFLRQSYTNLVSGRYSYTNSKTSQSFFANLFLQTAENYISNATFIPAADSAVNGTVLLKGSQLTKPVNLNGYSSIRTFFTYSMPLKFIKSNMNLNAGFNYAHLPGLSNGVKLVTNNTVYNAGVVLGSNISQYVDFNVSYSANFNQTSGSSVTSSNYVYQSVDFKINLLDKKGYFLQSDISYDANSGLGAGFNQKYSLWNAAIGKKFLKNQAGELKLSVFDLLKENKSITRTVNSYDIEDVQSEVLQRYFLLTFTYNLKNFGTPAKQTNRGGGNGRSMPGGFGGGS